jgi:hypothetical protein
MKIKKKAFSTWSQNSFANLNSVVRYYKFPKNPKSIPPDGHARFLSFGYIRGAIFKPRSKNVIQVVENSDFIPSYVHLSALRPHLNHDLMTLSL